MIKKNINQSVLIILLLTLISIFFIRFYNVFINHEIKDFFTSGYEEESLLILWYNFNNKEIYTNLLEYPYRWAPYNWLFYDFYSFSLKLINLIFDIHERSVINFFRLVTFFFSLIAFIFFYKSLKHIKDENNLWTIFLAIFCIYGLSTGWWNLTTRPDLPALAIEIIGIYFFLKNINNISILNIIIISIILFLAWSFKQTALITFCSITLYLLIQRKFLKCFLLISILFLLVSLTIFLQNDYYFQSIYMLNASGSVYDFDLNRIAKIINIFVLKNILLIFLGIYVVFKSKYLKFKENVFYLIGFSISLVYFLLVLSNKGTSDNHTFQIIIFLTLFIYKNFNYKKNFFYFNPIIFIIFITQILINSLVLFNIEGRLKPAKINNVDEYLNCMKDNLINPVFIEKNYHALPWITKYEQPTFINFNYKFELEANRLEDGGFQALIDKGFYKTLILNKNSTFRIRSYEVKKNCKDVTIYSLK